MNSQKQVRFFEDQRQNQQHTMASYTSSNSNSQRGHIHQQVRQVPIMQQPVLQQIPQTSNPKMQSAIQELRNSFNNQTAKLSASRVSDVMNETQQTIIRTPQQSGQSMCQPMYQPMCQSQQPYCQPYVVQSGGKENKYKNKIKKLKKLLKEQDDVQVSSITSTPKKQRVQMRDPEIDNIKKEIVELERVIRTIELQPTQSAQKEIEVHVDDKKKCMKKLCKKVKELEKQLFELARQRDEQMIIRQQLDKENQEMYDRINELEQVLKAADKKVFDLTVVNERQNGYIKQLECELERLRRKKKKVSRTDVKEVIVEKIVEKPIEIIKHIPIEKIIEKPIEIYRDIPSEPRIVEKIVEVPRIEYVDRIVPQYVDRVVEVPVDRIVEVPVERIVEVPIHIDRPVPYDRIKEVFVDRIVEVPYEIIKEIPIEIIREVPYEVIKEVPVERIVEVPKYIDRPYPQYIEVPVERIVDRVVEVPVERRVEVPVERRVEVPREVPVPYETYIDRPYRDEREINRLRSENQDLVLEIEQVRDKLRRELQNNNNLEQEIRYLHDQINASNNAIQGYSMDSDQLQQRIIKLEGELSRERSIVSDLQNRLDQMYHQVELLTSENNRKNDEFGKQLQKIERSHSRELKQVQNRYVVYHNMNTQQVQRQYQSPVNQGNILQSLSPQQQQQVRQQNQFQYSPQQQPIQR